MHISEVANTMHRFDRFRTFIAAWCGSLVELLLVLPLGLLVIEWLILPLALVIAALLAALCAGWVGTCRAKGATQTQLLPVIGVTVATAAALALLFLSLVWVGVASFGPLIIPVVMFSLLLALNATHATWRYRRPTQDRRGAVKLTVTVLVLAVLSVPLVVMLAARFGLAGA